MDLWDSMNAETQDVASWIDNAAFYREWKPTGRNINATEAEKFVRAYVKDESIEVSFTGVEWDKIAAMINE